MKRIVVAVALLLALVCAALAQVIAPGVPTGAGSSTTGQFQSSVVVSGSAVPMTTATPANITSFSLPAGDWDVQGACTSQPTGSTTTSVAICSISLNSNTLNTVVSDSSGFSLSNAAQPAGGAVTMVTDTARLSLGATTTVYLVGQYSFAVSTLSAYGKIRARRF